MIRALPPVAPSVSAHAVCIDSPYLMPEDGAEDQLRMSRLGANHMSATPDDSTETTGFFKILSPAVLSAMLFLGTLVLYLPALSNAFVNYDDPVYVTMNSHVSKGITLGNIRWAIFATAEANWHPLTWISHMADVRLFGVNPRGHHAVSVVLHGINVVLLFFVLSKATGAMLRSAMAAALFAVHPLNVETVAWVAERKSVLSMLFFLLALGAYGRYASKRNISRYLMVLGLFALGLAAKPMIVTFPVLLFLWDYWPLHRFAAIEGQPASSPSHLIAEKIPLLILSAASSWITVRAQRLGGALGVTDLLPLGVRIPNAIYSYVAYLGKCVWPTRLAVFYPHPERSLTAWSTSAAALLIVAATLAAWHRRKQRPYLIVGWLWYLVAMLPMIGIVQVGRQAMADRYAYLPFIGLFVIAVWSGADLFATAKLSPLAETTIAAAALIAYSSMTFLQISYWHNSYTLFSHALEVTDHNGIAEDNFGTALMEIGRPDLAFAHFQAAAEFIPQLSTAHYNLGVLQQQQNHLDAAQHEYELALKYSSDNTEIEQARSNLGFLLLGNGNLQAAADQFSAALQINPEKQNALLGRGIAQYRMGNLDAALADLFRSARIAPLAPADFWLGRALESKGDVQAAATAYEAALRLAPGMTDAQERLSALHIMP